MGNVSGWTEGIIFTLAFLAILAVVVAGFNTLYNQNHSIGITDNSGAEQLFINYQDTADQQISGGEVEFDAQQGISLKSSYGLTVDAIKIIWGFLSGGFIENVIEAWGVGTAGAIFAKSIRILWFLSLVFALLYALFKIKV